MELYKARKLGQYKVNAEDKNELRTILRHRQQYVVRNGLLYKNVQLSQRDMPSLQFVLPEKFRKQTMEARHNDAGHLGMERSFDLLKVRFYWPNMETDVEHHIRKCDRCLRFKAQPQRTNLHSLQATHPMEVIHVDSLTTESGKVVNGQQKDVTVLVVTDHFTRYVQALL